MIAEKVILGVLAKDRLRWWQLQEIVDATKNNRLEPGVPESRRRRVVYRNLIRLEYRLLVEDSTQCVNSVWVPVYRIADAGLREFAEWQMSKANVLPEPAWLPL